jgi:DNA-binding beta-propeller fold protein YncE
LNGAINVAKFNIGSFPQSLAFDPTGTTLYVADEYNGLIRAIALSTGVVSTYAGTLHATSDSDGPASTAGFVYPLGISVDAQGDVFVVESTGEGAVREITPGNPPMVQTLYDSNCQLSVGTDSPAGIVVDPAGKNVYVSDTSSLAIWTLHHP